MNRRFKKYFYITTMLGLLTSPSFSNDIYISQVGDTLDLDIVQDGQNNVIGTSGQAVVLGATSNVADNMTFSITQTGNTNTIAAQILGATYTGTWTFTGDNSDVILLCSSAATGNCDSVTLNIAAVGDNQDYTIKIGENASGDGATVNFTVTDDDNIISTDIDGTSAVVTVTINGASSLETTDSTLDIDIAGNGDSIGHTIVFNATGRGHAVVLNQSGVYDNMINLTTNGDNQAINITQSD
jgi:hypothetical protein|tara:strand:+ start:16025 stop:16747 length:723 start_codon:yes stop_codon:yes gene_type:complete